MPPILTEYTCIVQGKIYRLDLVDSLEESEFAAFFSARHMNFHFYFLQEIVFVYNIM